MGLRRAQDVDDELDSSTGESRAKSPMPPSREQSPVLQPGAVMAAAAVAAGRDLMSELSTPDARRKHVSASIIEGLIQARPPPAVATRRPRAHF